MPAISVKIGTIYTCNRICCGPYMPAISKIFKIPWKWSSWVKKLYKKSTLHAYNIRYIDIWFILNFPNSKLRRREDIPNLLNVSEIRKGWAGMQVILQRTNFDQLRFKFIEKDSLGYFGCFRLFCGCEKMSYSSNAPVLIKFDGNSKWTIRIPISKF